ncbi:MAG: helix-turn-helix domain-containing protein [Candidatus Omnitrophica bacterium]|nr:helix-turn-helix domain-containing protein [Candidatus Omnitrophota bacterium]
MGVTYKLKQEVIDYIVQLKTQDPAVSCRKLADIIKEKFNLEVSKSSIADVIKDFSLNSPVGRRAKAKPPKNFFIPQEKKETLLAQVAPFLSEEPVKPKEKTVEAPAMIVEPLPVVSEAPLRLRPDPVANPEAAERDAVEAALARDRKNVLLERGEPLRRVKIWGVDDGEVFQNAGVAVMLAALWERERSSLLGGAMARVAGLSLDNRRTSSLEGLLAFGMSSSSEWLDSRGALLKTFSQIYGISCAELADIYGAVIGKNLDLPRLALFFQTEMSGLLETAERIEFLCFSGKKFYADPLSFRLSSEASSAPGTGVPLFQLTEKVADSYVNNILPFVFEFNVFEGPFSESASFWKILQGLGEDAVDGVTAILCDGRKVPLFERLARVRRGFIARGVLSDKDRASVQFEGIGSERVFYDKAFDREFAYVEGLLPWAEKESLRVVLLSSRENDEKTVLVSNIDQTFLKAADMIEAVINRTPHYINKTHRVINFNPQDTVLKEFYGQNTPLSSILDSVCFRIFTSFYSCFVQEYSFPPAMEFWSALRAMPGYIKNRPDGLMIRLISDKSFPFLLPLQCAINELNSRSIKDHSGKQIFLTLQKSN